MLTELLQPFGSWLGVLINRPVIGCLELTVQRVWENSCILHFAFLWFGKLIVLWLTVRMLEVMVRLGFGFHLFASEEITFSWIFAHLVQRLFEQPGRLWNFTRYIKLVMLEKIESSPTHSTNAGVHDYAKFCFPWFWHVKRLDFLDCSLIRCVDELQRRDGTEEDHGRLWMELP